MIPYIESDGKEGNFSSVQVKWLEDVYKYYLEYMKKNSFVSFKCLRDRVDEKLQSSFYEYVFLVGDVSVSCKKNCLKILKKEPEIYFLRDNIKIMYDYRDYLKKYKYLIGKDTFLEGELSLLTSSFLKDNIRDINQKIFECKRDICICFYKDDSRVYFSLEISKIVQNIMKMEKGKKVVLGFDNLKDMQLLLRDNEFIKVNKNTLRSKMGDILGVNISSIGENYSVIVLPYLIRDVFHKDMFMKNEIERVKFTIYMALGYCKDKMYILCPISRKKEFEGVFSKLYNVKYLD